MNDMKTTDNPFIIGVTGHRKLPKERLPGIEQSVKSYYADMKASHKSVTVVSSLAEGADTLCAKLALEFGFRLIVSLPMSADEYQKDFRDTTDFDALLSKADEVFTVEPQEAVSDTPSRGFYYRQAGIYVTKHCNILLAVWDGEERDTPDGAGTWETIKLARRFGKPVVTVY